VTIGEIEFLSLTSFAVIRFSKGRRKARRSYRQRVMQTNYATPEWDLMEAERAPRTSSAFSAPGRYSAKRMTKPISFFHHSSSAKAVFLVGDFNDWNQTSHPLQRQPDGGWTIQIPLHHGHHRYLFLVDGAPTLDSNALGTARGPRGEKVSLIAVS
jgi:1,4-alpha-glucan branching enzyme